MGLIDGEEKKNCVSWWPSLARLLLVDSLILRVRLAGNERDFPCQI